MTKFFGNTVWDYWLQWGEDKKEQHFSWVCLKMLCNKPIQTYTLWPTRTDDWCKYLVINPHDNDVSSSAVHESNVPFRCRIGRGEIIDGLDSELIPLIFVPEWRIGCNNTLFYQFPMFVWNYIDYRLLRLVIWLHSSMINVYKTWNEAKQ